MSAADLPIPDDVWPTEVWPAQLVELADHVGAREALLIADAFGGTELYVPTNPDTEAGRRIAALIGDAKTATMCHVYGLTRPTFPVARSALLEARRRPIISAVRSGDMTVVQAAKTLGTNRTYMSHLVNHGPLLLEEGKEGHERRLGKRDPRQIEMFGAED